MTIVQPITGGGTRETQPTRTGGNVIAPLISTDKPIVERQPQGSSIQISEPKGLFQQISDFLHEKINPLVPGGIEAGIKRVIEAPLKEGFIATATAAEPIRRYFKTTAKAALSAIKGAGKLSPPYIAYRAVTGNSVKPKEYVSNVVNTGVDGLSAYWRMTPLAPILGASFGAFRALRQKSQGKDISWEQVIQAAEEGINEQPGLGQTVTDNVKHAQAIDIVFMVAMISRGFAKNKLSSLNQSADELTSVSKTLKVKPNATLKQVSDAMKREIKKIPEAFVDNPTAASLARRKELTDAFNILKKAGVVDKQYATAYEFLTSLFKGADDIPKAPVKAPVAALPPKAGQAAPVAPRGRPPAPKAPVPKAPAPKKVVSAPKAVAKAPTTKVKPKVVSVPREQLPVGEGAKKVSKLEARVKDTLTSASPETIDKLGLSTFNQMSKKSNIRKASKFVTESPENALKVLRGEIEAPKGILRNSIFVAMQNEAKGDVDLARKLASLQSTRFGQELSVLTEIDPDSPVTLMADVVNVRRKAFGDKYKGQTTDQVTKKVAKQIEAKIKKPSNAVWQAFVKSIEC